MHFSCLTILRKRGRWRQKCFNLSPDVITMHSSRLCQEHKREIEHIATNKDKCRNLVVEQCHKYHDRERLERCWDVKTAVAKCMHPRRQQNERLQLPHDIKHEEPVSVDLFLDSDDTDDLVARTLDYEGLHASLPSSLPQ